MRLFVLVCARLAARGVDDLAEDLPDADAEDLTYPDADANPDAEADPEADPGAEADAEADPEADPDADPDPDPDAETVTDPDPASGVGSEDEALSQLTQDHDEAASEPDEPDDAEDQPPVSAEDTYDTQEQGENEDIDVNADPDSASGLLEHKLGGTELDESGSADERAADLPEGAGAGDGDELGDLDPDQGGPAFDQEPGIGDDPDALSAAPEAPEGEGDFDGDLDDSLLETQKRAQQPRRSAQKAHHFRAPDEATDRAFDAKFAAAAKHLHGELRAMGPKASLLQTGDASGAAASDDASDASGALRAASPPPSADVGASNDSDDQKAWDRWVAKTKQSSWAELEANVAHLRKTADMFPEVHAASFVELASEPNVAAATQATNAAIDAFLQQTSRDLAELNKPHDTIAEALDAAKAASSFAETAGVA